MMYKLIQNANSRSWAVVFFGLALLIQCLQVIINTILVLR